MTREPATGDDRLPTELRRRRWSYLSGVLSFPIIVALFFLLMLVWLDSPLDWPLLFAFGLPSLTWVGYHLWSTPTTLTLDEGGIDLRYAFGRTRRVAYADLARVRLLGASTAQFRRRGRLYRGFDAPSFTGDFNAAVRRLLVGAREHGVPVKVMPRGAVGLGTRAEQARDLGAWEEQVGIRPRLPRAVVKRK